MKGELTVKKLVALLLIVCCLVALSGCAAITLPITMISTAYNAIYAANNPDYEGDPETFTVGAMSITLTDEFTHLEYEGASEFYSADGTYISAIRYPYASAGLDYGAGKEQCAEWILDALVSYDSTLAAGTVSFGEIVSEGEYASFTYKTATGFYSFGTYGPVAYYGIDALGAYVYVSTVYATRDGIWNIVYRCAEPEYDFYAPYFAAWAASVSFSDVNSSV